MRSLLSCTLTLCRQALYQIDPQPRHDSLDEAPASVRFDHGDIQAHCGLGSEGDARSASTTATPTAGAADAQSYRGEARFTARGVAGALSAPAGRFSLRRATLLAHGLATRKTCALSPFAASASLRGRRCPWRVSRPSSAALAQISTPGWTDRAVLHASARSQERRAQVPRGHCATQLDADRPEYCAH